MRTTIARKVGVLLVIPTAGAIAALFVSYRFVLDSSDSQVWIAVSNRQIEHVEKLADWARMVHEGQVEDQRALRQHADRFGRILLAMEEGGAVLGESLPPPRPELRSHLQEMRAAWDRAKAGLLPLSQDPVGSESAVRAYAGAMAALPGLMDSSESLIATVRAEAEMRERVMLWSLGGIALLDVGLLLAGLYLTGRFISRPVRQLEAAARRLRAGDFSGRVVAETHDELQLLAETFNESSRTIGILLGRLERERRVQDEIISHVPIGLASLSCDLVVLSVNQPLCERFGVTPEAVQGRLLDQALGVAELSAWLRNGAKAGKELLIERARGEGVRRLRLTLHRVEPGCEGSLFCYLLAVEDPTEHERMQLAALDATVNGIVITDRDGVIEWANSAYERIVATPRGSLVGRDIREVERGSHATGFYQAIWATLQAGQVWNGELAHKGPDGLPTVHRTTITPVRGIEGASEHLVGILEDVTEQRRLQEQFRQAQKMEAVGQLAGGVAHDFNNLLMVINGNADLLLGRLAQDDPVRRDIEEIRKAGERARALTRQLLAFSRRQILEPKVLDVNSLVVDMERMLRRLVGEDVDLAADLGSDLGQVRADRGQIEQVVMNLVVNARDAMPDGGRIALRTANEEIDAAAARDRPGLSPGSYTSLSVADTGCGMTPEVQAHLFEPFFTTKAQGKGTGLGLATVYGIVKQSGGYIAVESAPGRGTTFRILLPRVDSPVEEPLGPTAPSLAPAAGGTILLVEDEAMVREVVREFLLASGYQVVEAADPEEAIELAVRSAMEFDLLVTDVVMPRMTGPALAERICSVRPGVRVLYMSGYTTDAVLQAGLLRSESAFLQKPFRPEELVEKVRSLLAASVSTA